MGLIYCVVVISRLPPVHPVRVYNWCMVDVVLCCAMYWVTIEGVDQRWWLGFVFSCGGRYGVVMCDS